jgi:hypothetical protein
MILAVVNLYSLLQDLVLAISRRAGQWVFSGWIGVRPCRIVDMNFGESPLLWSPTQGRGWAGSSRERFENAKTDQAPRLVFRAHPGEARPKVELVRVQAV